MDPSSREWLRAAYDAGAVVVCDIVYAELAPSFRGRATLDGALHEIGATISPIDSSIAYEAGLRWQQLPGGRWAAAANHDRFPDRRSRHVGSGRLLDTGPRVLLHLLSRVEGSS